MNRDLKYILIAIAIISIIPIGFLTTVSLADRYVAGKWPYPPLAKRTSTTELSNGGKIIIKTTEHRNRAKFIEGVEYGFSASFKEVHDVLYQPPNSNSNEYVTGYNGYSDNKPVLAYLVRDLVVIPDPNNSHICVRASDNTWRSFSLEFPQKASIRTLESYYQSTSLSHDDLLYLRNLTAEHVVEDTRFLDFDPTSEEIRVKVSNNTVILKPSLNGKSLRLIKDRD